MAKLTFESELLAPLDTDTMGSLDAAALEIQQLAFARSEKLGQFAVGWLKHLCDPLRMPMEPCEFDAEATPIYTELEAELGQPVVQ